jgi:hypothetical protein
MSYFSIALFERALLSFYARFFAFNYLDLTVHRISILVRQKETYSPHIV